LANRSKSEIKNITVFGRHNREVPVYTKFDPSPYDKVHSTERMQATNVGDGIVDPTQTIPRVRYDVLAKDFGYEELNKRPTRAHDFQSKIITDNQARVIVKIDEKYGMQNGGLFGQSTFNHEQTSSVNKSERISNSSRKFSKAGTEVLQSDRQLKQLQDKKIELMERMLQNEKQENELMAERLGQKTLTKAMQAEILRVDGKNANLDSKPEVLGTAWSMH